MEINILLNKKLKNRRVETRGNSLTQVKKIYIIMRPIRIVLVFTALAENMICHYCKLRVNTKKMPTVWS